MNSQAATAHTHVEQPSSLKMVATLGITSLLSAVFIVIAVNATGPRIEQNMRDYLERAVFMVLPGADSRVTYTIEGDVLTALPEGTDDPTKAKVYAGYKDGQLVGVAIEAAQQGYQDIIRALYGYDPVQQRVIGFAVLESKETPGLGDRIAKDDRFLANFFAGAEAGQTLDVQLDSAGTTLLHEIQFAKSGEKTEQWQVEGISGATISSKTVANMINASCQEILPVIAKHLDQLKEGK